MGRRNRNRQLELMAQRENLEALEEEAEEWGDGVPSVRELGKLARWVVMYFGWFYLAYFVGFGWAVLALAGYLTTRLLITSLQGRAGSSQVARPRRREQLRSRD
jgi:hypothetical protein